jgi:hypothetical protein
MKNTSKLTKKQRILIDELELIYDKTGMAYWKIENYRDCYKTDVLEFQKNQIIRSVVIMKYALIDEHLSCAICKYFFGSKKNFYSLWKTKPFINFNHCILDKLIPSFKIKLALGARALSSGVYC